MRHNLVECLELGGFLSIAWFGNFNSIVFIPIQAKIVDLRHKL